MSILSGYKKFKKYIKTSSGFQLQSLWTSANTVEADDKRTIQTKVGAINGISSSETANSAEIAASTALTNKMNGTINNLSRDLGGLSFGQDADGNWGYKIGGADTVTPFKTEPFVYDFSDGTFNLSDSSKPYYVKDYKKLTKQNFHGSCSWSCYEYFHHTDTADHEHRNSGGISFTYSSDTGILTVKRNQTNGFITLVC